MNRNLFQQKLLELQANMLNFAYALTSNRDDAYDLLQDTTLKALDNEARYADNVNFKGWVFTIMRNIFINNYRRAFCSQTRIEPTDDLYHLDAASATAAAETPEGAYAASEVSEAIGRFAPEYREPFTMHLQGYRYSEIAERMQLPVGTIKSRIYYARQRLRQQLKDYAPGGAQ